MKKVFFALFAVVIAVGGSAFTNVSVPVGTIYGSTTGTNYTKRIATAYNNLDCQDNVAKMCAYQVTSEGVEFVTESSYTNQQLQDFKDDGYVVELGGAKTGIYLLN